jgi:ATP/maltotriose-dependent transcriptional regulator MalT
LAELSIDEGATEDARSLLEDAQRLIALVPYVPREQQANAVRRRLDDGRLHRRPPGMVEQLTGRELSVLGLLPTRLTPREIASELFLSHNTVKTHTRAIYRKLAVNTRHEAVEEARRLRLLGNHPVG